MLRTGLKQITNFICHSKKTATYFPFKSPKNFLSCIDQNNPQDPLLLQIKINTKKESNTICKDPLQEEKFIHTNGIIHKYTGRILIITTKHCAIHCRYCFRRNFDYAQNTITKNDFTNITQYIKNDSSIYEVILSGGDPFMLKNSLLEDLISNLQECSQLKYIRIHSRIPIVMPSRISPDLIRIISSTKAIKTILITHCNHAQEINNNTKHALQRLRENGSITLLNQSVLLKNVNDSAKTLINLSHVLFENGITPYYIHMLDKTLYNKHFYVSLRQAKKIMHCMQASLPGYLTPKLVKEVPFAPNKKIVS